MLLNSTLFCMLFTALCSCSGDNNKALKEDNDILSKTKATKTINTFDELDCEVYNLGAVNKSSGAKIAYSKGNSYKEGTGCFKLNYSFPGKGLKESVYFEQLWGDYRSDLSFYPLGISLWVKGNPKNKGLFRFIIMQDTKQFDSSKPHDSTRARWQYYKFEDANIMSKEGWNRIVMPYSAFTLCKQGTSSSNDLQLNRTEGYRIEIVNENGSANNGEIYIDNLEQLTSYSPIYGKPKFSSLFIQLDESYVNKDWDNQFKDSKEIGIDTWIIQYSETYDEENGNRTSFYKNTNLPWVTKKLDIIDKMVEAAERNGMKLILGLYPGFYSRTNTSNPYQYSVNLDRNKKLFDEVYEQFGGKTCIAGWYITEEFHDGSYPAGWQQEPALSMLANYLENVASYIKSKSNKSVSIAPALWRGMPADICGQWFGKIFSKTPNIDNLYLQDIGGRCLVDFDVDLPNWYATIKKACDDNGVNFGVDIESFKSCYCPQVSYHAKDWAELKQQLLVAGLYTTHITNFSWATFKKGTDNYTGYKRYLEENNLLNK